METDIDPVGTFRAIFIAAIPSVMFWLSAYYVCFGF